MLLINIGLLALAFYSHLILARPLDDIIECLGPRLSSGASITTNVSEAPRWSDYAAPQAGVLVNVAVEEDVAITVRYCNENNHRFLAQSGGNGWANTFDMSRGDVVINMRGLNSIEVSPDRHIIHIGGGVINGELIEAAYKNDIVVLNGGCNCVGVLGSTLGGGVSRQMNKYGLPADNLISANIVAATGDLIEVSSTSHPDLLWALRGAGANFGIVTSAVINAYPAIDRGRIWSGELLFSGDKLERFIDVVSDMDLNENMTNLWGFRYTEDGPVITSQISWLADDADAGRAAFASLYELEPDGDTTAVVGYNRLNDDTEELCQPGGRKPGWHVGMRNLDYDAWQGVWNLWTEFVDRTGLNLTTVLVECYSSYVLREERFRNTAAYAHRDIDYYAWMIPYWEDQVLDGAVEGFAGEVRELWRGSSGFEVQRAYMNFAHGDESLEEIYAESLPTLRELKRRWDPQGRFDQWFPIS